MLSERQEHPYMNTITVICTKQQIDELLKRYPMAEKRKMLHLYPSDMTPMSGTIVEPIFYDTLNRVLVFVILLINASI